MTVSSFVSSVVSGGARSVAGSGGAFTTISIAGLRLWLDASDSATVLNSIGPDVPATNGQTIRRWNDKSGNGYHANQATGANQPLLETGVQNSRPGISFDGSNDHLVASVTGFQSLADITVFQVVKPAEAAAADAGGILFWGFGDAGTPVRSLSLSGMNTGALTGEKIHVQSNNSGARRLGSSTYSRSANTCQIVCSKHLASGTSLQVNGSAVTLDLASGMTTGTAAGPAATGYTASDNFYLNAVLVNTVVAGGASKLCEFLIYSGSVSAADTTKILAYLNAKWGVY